MDRRRSRDSAERFASYLDELAGVMGHAAASGRCATTARGCCCRARGRAWSRSRRRRRRSASAPSTRRCCISWRRASGRTRWCSPRCASMVLPQIERHGPIEAWIIDDTRLSQAWGPFGRRDASVLRPARQAGQLPGRGLAVGRQPPREPARGLSAVSCRRAGRRTRSAAGRPACPTRSSSRPSPRSRSSRSHGRARRAFLAASC